MITGLLSSRTTSTYPLSIGTSLAMESIAKGSLPAYDDVFKSPVQVDLSKYSEIWIHTTTLHRNIIGSVGAQHLLELKPKDVAEVLSLEVSIIRDIIAQHAQTPLKVWFYTCGYSDMPKRFPHAVLREDKTEKQKQATDFLQQSLSLFYKDHSSEHATSLDKPCELIHFPNRLKPIKASHALLFSHYSVDLLSSKHFDSVDLLESHSGQIKNSGMWYTKLLDSKELLRIPFNKMTLQVFGDRTTFHPMKKQIRDEIIDLSVKFKWNSHTSIDRVRLGLSFMKDKYTADILDTML